MCSKELRDCPEQRGQIARCELFVVALLCDLGLAHYDVRLGAEHVGPQTVMLDGFLSLVSYWRRFKFRSNAEGVSHD
jgi:hypothetical protein